MQKVARFAYKWTLSYYHTAKIYLQYELKHKVALGIFFRLQVNNYLLSIMLHRIVKRTNFKYKKMQFKETYILFNSNAHLASEVYKKNFLPMIINFLYIAQYKQQVQTQIIHKYICIYTHNIIRTVEFYFYARANH